MATIWESSIVLVVAMRSVSAMAVEVMEILQAINIRGTTVLVATHDVGLQDRFPHRRLRFEGGRLADVPRRARA